MTKPENTEKKIEELQKTGGKKFNKKILETIENYKKLTDEEKNCFHIYYGYGKGKTTATMGLAVRALGAGKKVAIVQFDKGHNPDKEHYAERTILRKLKEDGYPVEIYPTGCERMNADGTFRFKNHEEDFKEAQRGLGIAKELIEKGGIDLLILDEAIAAVDYHLLDKKAVDDLIDLYKKNKKFELVMTGHKLWEGLEEKADLVTEMRKVKHYFDAGIPAREGIEFQRLEYEVTKCICFDTTFKEMKELMEKNNLKTLKELQQYINVGLNCKLCVPYIEKMIETGRTGFSLDDVPSANL